MVTVGTHRLNMVCQGPEDAEPVVIFEAGGGGTSAAWRSVQGALPASIRACAYDRAGSGKSEAGPEPRSMDAEVADLHALLEAAGLKGPVVLVAHSLGGLLARLFVARYPDALAGVILLDPTDEDDLVFNTGLNRWIRVAELDGPLGDGARRAAALRQANATPFGNRPLVVVGAGKRTRPPGPSAEEWESMKASRDRRVEEQSRLSTNPKFRLDTASSHDIERDNPSLVAGIIEDMVRRLNRK